MTYDTFIAGGLKKIVQIDDAYFATSWHFAYYAIMHYSFQKLRSFIMRTEYSEEEFIMS
jgi:hypothetical protein